MILVSLNYNWYNEYEKDFINLKMLPLIIVIIIIISH